MSGSVGERGRQCGAMEEVNRERARSIRKNGGDCGGEGRTEGESVRRGRTRRA